MKTDIVCDDEYEAQKLMSLIFIKEDKETYISGILNIIKNEIIISLKDKSAHSILLKDEKNVEKFADFIQSVFDQEHDLVSTKMNKSTIIIIIYIVGLIFGALVLDIWSAETSPKALIGIGWTALLLIGLFFAEKNERN